jgi:peroxiredoxin
LRLSTELAAKGLANMGAMMTDAAPDIELPDHTGQTWQLDRALDHGPVLVVFYRGDW